jgi:hypothetical protein
MNSVQKHKYEILIVILVIGILGAIQIPRFLQKQESAKVAHIQKTLNKLVEKLLEEPFIFYDNYMTGNNHPEAVMMNGDVFYTSMVADSFERHSNELHEMISDYKLPPNIESQVYHFLGGHISGNKEVWRNRTDYVYDRHWVCVYVNLNGLSDSSSHFEYKHTGKKEMAFPKPEYLFNPSNGLDSPGILYAHTYEYYLRHHKENG